jgi:hypothetical protein
MKSAPKSAARKSQLPLESRFFLFKFVPKITVPLRFLLRFFRDVPDVSSGHQMSPIVLAENEVSVNRLDFSLRKRDA